MYSNAIKRLLVLPVLLALTLAGLGVYRSAPATAVSGGLVISEVYGGGGNSGATYNQDFVELYNPTGASISVASMSVQYRSASGTSNPTGVVPLSGSVPAGEHYLVGLATGATGVAIPAPNVTNTGVNLSATNGTVFLANQTTALTAPPTGSVVGNPAIIDLVGFGTSNTFETTAAAAPANNTVSLTRTGVDTDVNSADFAAATPTPQAAPSGGGGGDCGTKTIAEIQGDTDTSPCVGKTVTTTGVVTASYPTGGFNGFYLQTGGTPDTPDASDGIFVYGGPGGFASYPTVGTTVDVGGTVAEFAGQTEIDNATVTAAAVAQPAVVPLTDVPGTDCALPGDGCLTGTALDAARERHESELYQPTGDYTVTDPYDGSPSPSTSSSFFGEIGLAADSASSLMAPTEVADAQDHPAIAARTAYNNAHLIVLDDGSSTNYSTVTGQPFPWLTPTHYVRDNAAVSFPKPVVLTYRNSEWKLEPQRQVTDAGTDAVTFAQDRPAAPQPVGGNLKLATFNVLNYFTTLGADVAAADGCTAYNDRDGNPITVNTCTAANGPRGAWTAASLQRQQDKIVHAINAIGADIMSLEEIENSLTVEGADRDSALSTLVAALNADAGTTRWAYVPSPAELPSGEDVIRTGFIYNPSTVTPVGASQILIGAASFDIAREPLAQAFKRVGDTDAHAFAVIVNHFKSKGSGDPDPDGQGNSNDTRIQEANDLVTFADDFKASHGLSKVYLTGDFNAYSEEDPVQVLEAAGYVDLAGEKDPGEKSYNFGGLDGSLDHVFANAAAEPAVTGVDIWNINANESVYYEYSRFNYNVTNLYDASPYRASDHNPEIVGLDIPAVQPPTQVTASDSVMVYGLPTLVRVAVAGGATGSVRVVKDGATLGTATISHGVAWVPLPARSLDPGVQSLTAVYDGDAAHGPGSDPLKVTVLKAPSWISAVVTPSRVVVGTPPQVRVTVSAVGVRPTGTVTVSGEGQPTRTVALDADGRAVVQLDAYAQKGTKTLVVRYSGDQYVAASSTTVTVRVEKK